MMHRLLLLLLAALAHGCLSAQPVGAGEFFDAALAAARKQKVTAAQVEKLDCPGTAALAGVKLGPKGESPTTFFYEQVRRDVARVLAAEEKAAAEATQMATLTAKIKEAFPTAEVAVRDDGTWEVKKLTTTISAESIRIVETKPDWTAMLVLAGSAATLAGLAGHSLGRRKPKTDAEQEEGVA